MSPSPETGDFTKNFIIGGFAGGISRTITSPLEITKMLQQNYPHSYGNQSVGRIIRNIYSTTGFKSLFKGNVINCTRIIPQNAIQLSFYKYFSDIGDKLYPRHPNVNSFIGASAAGILSYSAIYPLETVRSKLSVDITGSNKQYKSLLSATKYSIRKNGFKSLYNGWGVSAIGMIPYQGITFSTYKYVHDKYNSNNNRLLNLPIGSLASICAITITYPCDVIKRKYHLSGELGNKNYKSYTDLIKTTYIDSGLKGFYRGLWSCYLKTVPCSAIFFFTIELLKE